MVDIGGRWFEYEPDYSVPPGETLRETLEALGLSQVDLAERAGLSTKHVNQIIQGAASISPETALLLERTTGVPARVWNRLESNFQEQQIRLSERKRLARSINWLEGLPLKELVRREWIRRQSHPGAQLEELLRFFGVADRDALERVWLKPQAAFRVSKAYEVDALALAAWLRIGELQATEVECRPFDRGAFTDALSRIRRLTPRPPEEFEERMKRFCARSGVAVVIEPEIRGARVSGAARWLTPTKALIQLSLRYKWEDQFWFSFFHEAGHILRHSKKDTFVHAGTSEDRFEQDANNFAQHFLIPREFEDELQDLHLEEVRDFAKRLGVAPGIVVGRLQRERGVYNWGNSLRRRFEFAT